MATPTSCKDTVFQARVRLLLKRKIWELAPSLRVHAFFLPTPALEALFNALRYGSSRPNGQGKRKP